MTLEISMEMDTSSSNNQNPSPSSELYDLVLDLKWKAVVEHAKLFPQDASYQEEDSGETPLYLALQINPPIEAVAALVEVDPFIVTLPQTRNYDTPLHIAGWYRLSTDIWRLLVKAAAGAHRPYSESSLLHTTSKWGRTPLVTLCEGFADTEGQVVDRGVQWERIKIILLHGKDRHNSDEDETFAIFGVMARLGAKLCPCKVLRMAIHRRIQQASSFLVGKDHSRHSLLIRQLLRAHVCQANTFKNRFFIETFLTLGGDQDNSGPPTAVKIKDRRGRLPLHVALAHGHTWDGGVDLIWRAHPDAVEQKDPVTGLYPFQMAVVAYGCCCPRDNLVLETTFQLLVARPQALALARDSLRRDESMRKDKQNTAVAEQMIFT